MKKIFIHVGLPKTGTTFLQDIIFPKINNTVLLAKPYTQISKAFNQLQYVDDCYYNSEDLVKEIEAIQGETILISDEALCGSSLTGEGTTNRSLIAKRFKEIFPEAEIIVFLRGQKSFLGSSYNQAVKMGYSNSIQHYIWHPKGKYTYENYLQDLSKNEFKPNFRHGNSARYQNTLATHIHLTDLYYYELIKLYKDNFEKTHVFLYEELCEKPQAIISQLEDILGNKVIDLDNISLSTKTNSKFDAYKLKRTRAINKIKLITKNRNKYLLHGSGLLYRLMTNEFKKPLDLEEKYIAKITENFYVDNNQKIVNEYPNIGIQNYPQHYQLLKTST